MKKRCPDEKCFATNPPIVKQNFSLLPEKIQAKLKIKHWNEETFWRCSYCGTIWVEDFNLNEMKVKKHQIGTRNLDSNKMIWFI